MQVFSVFEIRYGSYGDYYNLISICSTQEKAEDVIKTVIIFIWFYYLLFKYAFKDLYTYYIHHGLFERKA